MTAARAVPVLIFLLKIAAAFYEEGDAVQLLTAKTFDTIQTYPGISVVEFYAPWCGHCQKLAPAYSKIAESLKGIVQVAAVDCDDGANKKLCSKNGVQGFPTIKIYPAEGQLNPYTHEFAKVPTDFQGPRTAKAISDAATAAIPSALITTIKSAPALKAFRASNTSMPKALLVTQKAQASPLFRAMSVRFKGRAQFVAVTGSQAPELQGELGIERLPGIVLLPVQGGTVTYGGQAKAAELAPFLEEHALPEAAGAVKGPKDPAALELGPVEMTHLGEAERLAEAPGAWLVGLFADDGQAGACAEKLTNFSVAVIQLSGLVKAAVVNVSQGCGQAATSKSSSCSETLAFDVDLSRLRGQACGFEIVLLPHGDLRDSSAWPEPFKGELGARELQKYALQGFSQPLPRLGPATLQAFLALAPQRPKVLLFTDKPQTPPMFQALAANLESLGLLFADVAARDADVLQQFGVEKTPAMRLAFLPPNAEAEEPGPESSDGASGGKRLAIQPYPGKMSYAAMAQFLTSFAGIFGPQAPEHPDVATRRKAGPMTVPQLDDHGSFSSTCTAPGTCLLTILDGSQAEGSASHHAQRLDMLKEGASRVPGPFPKAGWVDASRQGSFLSKLGLSSQDAPTCVLLRQLQPTFQMARMAGSFSSDSIAAFLTRPDFQLLHQQELPRLVDGGEDPAPEALEEEFDLREVLGESVSQGAAASADRLAAVEAELQEQEQERLRLEAEQANAAASSKPKKPKKKRKGKPKAAGSDEL